MAETKPSEVNKEVKPILEMFSNQLKHPNLTAVMANWKDLLQKGMFHFGRKETLNEDLDFNLLVHSKFEPHANKSGTRVILDITTEVAGVITNKRYRHENPKYLKNEMVVVRAVGKWDYAENKGFRKMKIDPTVHLRVPPTVEKDLKTNGPKYIAEVSKQCFAWLIANRMQKGQ